MADITLSASVRRNLLSLQSANKLLDRTSERLGTGLKVNSALDNPSSFFTSRSLTNRASDLAKLKDGIGQGIQTLKAADTAISSLTTLVEQAQSIAESAKETAAAAAGTTAKQESITAGSSGTTTAATMSAAFSATLSGTGGFSFGIVLSGGAASVNLDFSGANTIAQVVAAISAVDSAITATYNTVTDKIEIDATDGTTVTITNGAGSTNAITGLFTGVTSGTAFSFGSVSGSVSQSETDFNAILTQINDLVGDAGYKGVNLINSNDLTVTFNEDGTSKLTVSGTDLTTTGLNISTASWQGAATSVIETSITQVKNALTELRSAASSFGNSLSIMQTREDFTKNFINSLEEGSSRLVNADLEEESANLLALQTRQALGTTSLSIAASAQQSILSLFR